MPYSADRRRAEAILLEAARTHTVKAAELGEEALRKFEQRYFTARSAIMPRVYFRLTDNWVELAVRFIAEVHVGLPPLRVTLAGDERARADQNDDKDAARGDAPRRPPH